MAFEPLKFKLSEPIKTHKGEVRELELNMVKARCFVKYGNPFKEISSGQRENRETRFEFDFNAVIGFAAEATGIDTLILQDISGVDVIPLGYKIMELITQRPNA